MKTRVLDSYDAMSRRKPWVEVASILVEFLFDCLKSMFYDVCWCPGARGIEETAQEEDGGARGTTPFDVHVKTS